MKNTNYTKQIISDYCVLDTETTGLSSYYDEVIEIGILRIRDNKIVGRYSQLVQPKYEIDSFVTSLTGITNEMVANCHPYWTSKKRCYHLLVMISLLGIILHLI